MSKETVQLTIPPDVDISDLELEFVDGTNLRFNWAPIHRICEASNFPFENFTEKQDDNVSALLHGWYELHINNGGEPDPVAEFILAEVKAMKRIGQKVQFFPGHA